MNNVTWVDTHAHLYAREFDDDRQNMLQRASDAGIKAIVLPNIDLDSIGIMHDLEEASKGLCHAAMGLHPCSVKADYKNVLSHIENLLQQRPYVAIGETGTDFYWDTTFVKEQEDSFVTQLKWSAASGLPVIIHARDSLDRTIALVEENQDGRLTGVFHCFDGTPEQAERIIDLGFYLGIGGVFTYKKSNLKHYVQSLPASQLLLETDAPYLSPVPFRGKRNESSYVLHTAEKLSEALEISMPELAGITTENAGRLFRV